MIVMALRTDGNHRYSRTKNQEANGGIIISESNFHAPDGTVAEIVGFGRYKKAEEKRA